MCDYPGCERNFVRLDLCNRHRDRHTAKGSSLNRKDPVPSQTSPAQESRPAFGHPGSASPETNRPGTGYNKMSNGGLGLHTNYSPKASTTMPYTPISGSRTPAYTNGFPATNGGEYPPRDAGNANYGQPSSARQRPQTLFHSPTAPQRPTVQTNGMYDVMSPTIPNSGFHSQNHTSTPQSAVFVPAGNFPAFDLPPSNFVAPAPVTTMAREEALAATTSSNMSYMSRTTADYDNVPAGQSGSEMMVLDQMTIPNTMPVFGTDSILQKSPHVALPEDFMVYLFNSTPQEGSPLPGGYVESACLFVLYASFHIY